jgi:hypothetical protein
MAHPKPTSDEIAQLGNAIYERDIRPRVEHDHHGEVVVIDIDTGEFEVSPDHLTAARNARIKRPDATLFAVRVGYPALARIGGRSMTRPRS